MPEREVRDSVGRADVYPVGEPLRVSDRPYTHLLSADLKTLSRIVRPDIWIPSIE